jgi:alanine or glycine:cation symporter, AGCS family
MGIMAVLNLVVIAVLGRVAFKVLDDFSAQRRKGLNPVFKASSIPGLKNAECWEEPKERDNL